MRAFDQRFVEEVSAILRGIPVDRKPDWGSMNVTQMFAHIVTAIGYSLGKVPETPNEGGLLGRLIAPIFINGLMPRPRGVKAPKFYAAAAPGATAEELIAALEEFRVQHTQPGFAPPAHPFFGPLDARGWAKLHIVHLEHHLCQFGAAPRHFARG